MRNENGTGNSEEYTRNNQKAENDKDADKSLNSFAPQEHIRSNKMFFGLNMLTTLFL